MTDVLQNALKYRTQLRGELTKVEEFLRMAEEFSRLGNSEETVKLFAKTAPNLPDMKQPEKQPERPRPAANGAGTS